MTAPPTVLICAGATKTGTSWLYDYFARHPDCHLRSIKELHYFDYHDGISPWLCKQVGDGLTEVKVKLASVSAERAVQQNVRHLHDLRELTRLLRTPVSEAAYLDYLTRGNPGRKLVGDFTPAYALLSVDRLRKIGRMAPDVRVLYVMRDPLARLWSHVRMVAGRIATDSQPLTVAAASTLDRVIDGADAEIAKRSDYGGALQRLKSAIEPERLMVAFYEELLTDEGIRSLCAYLNVAHVPPKLDNRRHVGSSMPMDARQKQRALDWLRPQYDNVERMMGRLPQAWHTALAEV